MATREIQQREAENTLDVVRELITQLPPWLAAPLRVVTVLVLLLRSLLETRASQIAFVIVILAVVGAGAVQKELLEALTK